MQVSKVNALDGCVVSAVDPSRVAVVVTIRHGIGHGTFQVEPDIHVGCDEVTW